MSVESQLLAYLLKPICALILDYFSPDQLLWQKAWIERIVVIISADRNCEFPHSHEHAIVTVQKFEGEIAVFVRWSVDQFLARWVDPETSLLQVLHFHFCPCRFPGIALAIRKALTDSQQSRCNANLGVTVLKERSNANEAESHVTSKAVRSVG